MAERLAAEELDLILALQVSIAWAGESAGEPKRLGWWKTDLVDPEGGGDLWRRLAPRTAPWAALGLVRKAALSVDRAAREQVARRDRIWTLFHFSFAVDEQLGDRLDYHRRHRHVPVEVFGDGYWVGGEWSKTEFADRLSSLGEPKVEVTPTGRRVTRASEEPGAAALLLAAALAPLTDAYPLPYVELAA